MNSRIFTLISIVCGAILFAVVACGQRAEKKSGQSSDITKTEREYLKAVENYVDSSLKENGSLPVKTLKGKSVKFDGPLKMTKLHRKKVITYDKENGIYFVCSNFKSNPEGKEGTKYDFDFFMKKTDGGWELAKNLDWPPVLLHKIEGEPQLTYKNNKPVAADSG